MSYLPCIFQFWNKYSVANLIDLYQDLLLNGAVTQNGENTVFENNRKTEKKLKTVYRRLFMFCLCVSKLNNTATIFWIQF